LIEISNDWHYRKKFLGIWVNAIFSCY
jgi:hypothetical protein